MEKTTFDEPFDFVDARYINVRRQVLKQKNTSKGEQERLHWETKSTVARQIFVDHKTVGDEDSFYKACYTFVICTQKYKILRALFPEKDSNGNLVKRSYIAVIGAYLENLLMVVIGNINRWGSSIIRPILLLLASFIVFSIIYLIVGGSLTSALAKSFEISSVAGYTRGAVSLPESNFIGPRTLRALEWLELIFSIFFYTIFFSTVTSRISRVR